jgi:hypothetical protein
MNSRERYQALFAGERLDRALSGWGLGQYSAICPT